MATKYTTSGIIRNSEKPRSGVVSTNNLASWIYDTIHEGIDLGYEEWALSVIEEIRQEIKLNDENDELSEDEINEQVEQELENAHYSPDDSTILFGDWKKDKNGFYVPNTKGEFAAIFTSNGFGDLVTVEWSKHTAKCGHTSPCFVMSNGDGPCGDLDSEGDSVLAYTLPPEFFGKE